VAERQQYYKELIAYIIEKHYAVKIDLTTDTEVPTPNIRVDMVFEIPKRKLSKASASPFPYLAEINILHIKAVNDRLTREDVIQYLGELYILATSARAKEKSVVLTIVSAEQVGPSIVEGLRSRIEATKIPWISKIEAELPAYIFTLERLPREKQYQCFLPFQPLSVLEVAKENIQQITQQKPATQENIMLLFWLRKLQPEFFKEIEMPRDMVEVIEELCPEALQKKVKESIVKVLQARFGLIGEETNNKINALTSSEALDVLLKGAATVKTLEDFKQLL
jgi:hypothetical protein